MKRRVLFSFLIIAMAMAAITGGTLAWFTAEADVESTFQAGTVILGEIDVDYNDGIDNWNPGDEEDLEYKITYTGSKNAFLRVKFDGAWTGGDDAADEADPVEITLHLESADDWDLDESTGYFYYIGEIVADESTPPQEVIKITLDFVGANAGNEFQGATYTLTATFEAIQSSNDAEVDAWGVEWDTETSPSEWDFTSQD